ncbi:MAG: hypothetical protein R3F14_38210 [Polyangiaceae bacterium]
MEVYLDTAEALASYADADGSNAEENRAQDMDALFGHVSQPDMWLTTLSAELSRKALSNDLQLQASLTQENVYNWIQIEEAIGTPPEPPTPCGFSEEPPADDKIGGTFGVHISGDNASDGPSGLSCAASRGGGAAPFGGAVVGSLLAAATMLFRRRTRGGPPSRNPSSRRARNTG